MYKSNLGLRHIEYFVCQIHECVDIGGIYRNAEFFRRDNGVSHAAERYIAGDLSIAFDLDFLAGIEE